MKLVVPIQRHGSVPAYLQIKEQLKVNIRAANLAPHSMLPNLKTLAEEAKVSIRTVDLAIGELVSEGICYRRPKKGTFIAEAEAGFPLAGAAAAAQRRIGLLPVPPSEIFRLQCDLALANLYTGFYRAATSVAGDLIMAGDDVEAALEFYGGQRNMALKGVVLMNFTGIDEAVKLALKHPELKFVYANYFFEFFENTPDNVYGVFNDDFSGAYRIVEYFLARGYSRPALCSMEIADLNYHARLRGFRQAAADAGMTAELPFFSGASGDAEINIASGMAAADAFFAMANPPDIVFCTNDHLACGLMKYMHRNPGREMTVVGYDGQLPFGYENYRFSTVQIDFAGIGARAVETIFSDRYAPKQIRIQPDLKIV